MKTMRLPILILAALFLLSFGSGVATTLQTQRWQLLLNSAERNAMAENWTQTELSLDTLSDSWDTWQTYLHITITHDEIDHADELLRLCRLYSTQKDTTSLRSAVSQLYGQFSLLAEIGALSIKNVL